MEGIQDGTNRSNQSSPQVGEGGLTRWYADTDIEINAAGKQIHHYS
jgi:hypothetical protein